MLKACLILNRPNANVKEYEHNIIYLWALDECEPLRGHIYVNANLVVQEDRGNPSYLGVPDENEDIIALIEGHVAALGELHARKKVYPLRYPSSSETKVPRTPFLVKSLWSTADDLVKRPNEFRIDDFHA